MYYLQGAPCPAREVEATKQSIRGVYVTAIKKAFHFKHSKEVVRCGTFVKST